MKIRLEPKKTTLRLSKVEFSDLLERRMLADSFELPSDKTVELHVSLHDKQKYIFEKNIFQICLPIQELNNYRPNKNGLSFYFQQDNQNKHELLFEVDIKKKPINI